MTRNRFIPKATPFQQLTKITNTFNIIQYQQKNQKFTSFLNRLKKKKERTIEERKHGHCKGFEERELQLGV